MQDTGGMNVNVIYMDFIHIKVGGQGSFSAGSPIRVHIFESFKEG
jgi:hypothetical protein